MKLKLWVKVVLSLILTISSIITILQLSGEGTNTDLLRLIYVEINCLIVFLLVEDKINKDGE